MAALRLRFLPVRMETWSAEARNSYEACKRHLSECNVMILFLTERYGSIHPESGKSYTEMEYDAALEIGIPVLAFLSELPILPTDKIDPQDLEKAKRFRERIGTSFQGRFKSTNQLELLVFQSLQEWLKDLIEASLKHDTESQVIIKDENINTSNSLDLAAFNRLQVFINSNWIQDFEFIQLNYPQYVRKYIRDNLIDYLYESEKAENEFFNKEILLSHNKFISSITAFLKDIATITKFDHPDDEALTIRTKTVKKWIDDYDERYEREVNIIIDRAENIIENYKNFIRICRFEGIFK